MHGSQRVAARKLFWELAEHVNSTPSGVDSELRRRGQGPALTGDDAESLAKGDELVGRDIFELLVEAIGPMDVDIDRAVRAQAKMQSRVIAGVEARLAQDGLRV